MLKSILKYFTRAESEPLINTESVNNDKVLDDIKKQIKEGANVPPAGRVSSPDYGNSKGILTISEDWAKPSFLLENIKVIRSLKNHNADVGSVYNDLIQLTNTGHKISFSQSIPSELQDKMINHLEKVRDTWGTGVHGIDGIINKMIGQLWVSGAISGEWVINDNLDGVVNYVFVNPENIKFKYQKRTTKYKKYQYVPNRLGLSKDLNSNLIELNEFTYQYVGILGDTDSPYGVPPFLTALEDIADQKLMKKNIKHILKQLGILGYLEVTVEKPEQRADEKTSAYEARLKSYLAQTKKNVSEGFAEGTVVGYQEEHEFEFHATTKNLTGVTDLFSQTETQIANGLKSSPSFIGQKSSGTETMMGIVFTKMLSQLKSVHQILSFILSYGYLLELRLAGYDVDKVVVEFNPSTISDDLKLWQSKEIKQRVLKALLIDGIISQDQYAEAMGYEQPYSKKPLIPYSKQGKAPTEKAKDKQQREKSKDTSDRRVRDKNKTQPKRKDQNTKPQ